MDTTDVAHNIQDPLNPKIKLLIALPVLGPVPVATVQSLIALDLDGIDHEWAWIAHTITSAARNIAASRAVSEEFTHLLFLDADMTFHPQTIKRLLSHDVDIVSGVYGPRRGDGPPFAFMFEQIDPNEPMAILPWHIDEIQIRGPQLRLVDGVPTGCLLINTRVFATIDKKFGDDTPHSGQPYFFYDDRLELNRRFVLRSAEAIANNHVDASALERYKPPSAGDASTWKYGYGLGEDLRFCALARAAGIKVHIDTRLRCGHLGEIERGSAALYND